jgi:hypothetical protein
MQPVFIDFGEQILAMKPNDEGFYFERVEKESEYNGNAYTSIRYKGWGHYLTRENAKIMIFGKNYSPIKQDFLEENKCERGCYLE